MPVPICPRKDSERGLIQQGIKCQSAPSSHVRKIKSRFGILVNWPSHFLFYSVANQEIKIHYSVDVLFLLNMTRSWRLGEIRWSVYTSKPQMISSVPFSRIIRFRVVHKRFVRTVKFEFLPQFRVDDISQTAVSSVILLCSKLLHSLIMRLIVSSQSPHHLPLLFLCNLSIFWFNVVRP